MRICDVNIFMHYILVRFIFVYFTVLYEMFSFLEFISLDYSSPSLRRVKVLVYHGPTNACSGRWRVEKTSAFPFSFQALCQSAVKDC